MAVADPWQQAKNVIGGRRLVLGPQAADQYLNAPDHLAMVLSRYRAAAALIGGADRVLELGCGEGIGAGILAKSRTYYCGVDNDEAAIRIARETHARSNGITFAHLDVIESQWLPETLYDAAVSLDVIEHVPAEYERAFVGNLRALLPDHGVCVIGTPNAAFEHLASPQSKAGHVNLYTHARLHALMRKHFRVVQSFGMQDTSLHFGHTEARHYLLMVGIGPVR